MMFPTVMNSLSVGMFSSLRKHSGAVYRLTLINFARQANICGERFSFIKENKKFVFKNISQQTLVTFHLSL